MWDYVSVICKALRPGVWAKRKWAYIQVMLGSKWQWYLAATRGFTCKPDVQDMLYLTKPQKKYRISSANLLYVLSGWAIFTIFVAEQKPSSPCLILHTEVEHLHVQLLLILLGRKEAFARTEQKKLFSLDYALQTKTLCKAKLLSLTLWSTLMLNISYLNVLRSQYSNS